MRPLVAAAVAFVAVVVAAPASAKDPRCFGAADRDPFVRCDNPRLDRRVTPTPNQAVVQPNLACTRTGVDETVEQCAFGVAAAEALETVAVIGDSHAAHWRAGLQVVAEAKRWRVLEIATPHCPFSMSTPKGDARRWCGAWNDKVLAWLADHPELRTLIVSNHSKAPVLVPEGSDERTTRVAGFVAMWDRLPASVRRVAVLRDVPLDRVRTHDCVRRAKRDGRRIGRACALRRRSVLHEDTAVAAAAVSTRAPEVVDLTPHFCGPTRCFPVVGGVLVHKDTDHLTQLFARTLGPYVLRALG